MKSIIMVPLLAWGVALPAFSQTPIRKLFDAMPDAKLASIPNFVLPAVYKDRTAHPLPSKVDNSSKQWFPPYGWTIKGWSCANASATSYAYNYEVQRQLNLPSKDSTPYITYEYTYHFLNSGNQSEGGDGWMFVEAFDILKETGGPTSTDFGGFEWGDAGGGWMSGYDKYYKAMKIRAEEYYKIDAALAANDELIKQYLFDHGDGSPEGGLLVFQANSENWSTGGTGPDGSPVFTKLGGGGGHSLTVVGYDDTFQGGSYKVCNNWGDGFYWAPYKLFRTGAGLATRQGTPFMFVRVKKNYSPQLTFKINITHNQRGSIAIMAGVANSATATAPEFTKDYAGAFNYTGGNFPMMGKGMSSTLEIGLDLTDLARHITGTSAKFFLQVKSKGGTGQINSLSLMDYSGSAVVEKPSGESNKAIPTGTTLMSVAWTGKVTALGQSQSPKTSASAGFSASPNPAFRGTGSVRIAFPASEASLAKLTIRDARGHVVRAAAMNLGAASPAAFSWELNDSQGVRVAPGLYFASVELWKGHARINSATTRVRVAD
jgi:hypothetical protein